MNTIYINLMLLGAITMACFTVSLFFLRCWKATHDRFFLFFSVSFGIEGFNRILLGWMPYSDEYEPILYLIRFFAFLVILYAIIDKNWIRNRKLPTQ